MLKLFKSKVEGDSSWSLITSDTLDPFKNLSFENLLLREDLSPLRNLLGPNVIFLYRNDSCLVSGRFQIPWKEINFHSKGGEIPYVRRRSGGGTVYHDEGNWNFCFIRSGRELKREENLSIIIKALSQLGIEATSNDRFDLICRDKKISGSAFKQKKDIHLHHGTLLIKADLLGLKGSLGCTTGWAIEGKGIASVSSPVMNLCEVKPITFDQFIASLANVGGINLAEPTLIRNFMGAAVFDLMTNEEEEELRSWSWRFGECPAHTITFENFTIKGEKLQLTLKKGRIIEARHGQELDNALQFLVGISVKTMTDQELSKNLSGLIHEDAHQVLKDLSAILCLSHNS